MISEPLKGLASLSPTLKVAYIGWARRAATTVTLMSFHWLLAHMSFPPWSMNRVLSQSLRNAKPRSVWCLGVRTVCPMNCAKLCTAWAHCASHTTAPELLIEAATQSGMPAQSTDQVKQHLVRALICSANGRVLRNYHGAVGDFLLGLSLPMVVYMLDYFLLQSLPRDKGTPDDVSTLAAPVHFAPAAMNMHYVRRDEGFHMYRFVNFGGYQMIMTHASVPKCTDPMEYVRRHNGKPLENGRLIAILFSPKGHFQDAVVVFGPLDWWWIPHSVAEIDETVRKQTLQELEDGWLRGPIPLNEIPEECPISKRFGIRQGNKIRMTDNFAESAVNDAVTVHESPVLRTVDVAAAMAGAYFKSCKSVGRSSELVTRTYDLSSAYKQVAVHPNDRWLGLIYVYNPGENDWNYFGTQVLLFGAVRSVHCFLRLARAVWFIGTVGLRIPWTSFFDDFVVVSCPGLARSTEFAILESLFFLLGWKFSESGKKYVSFSEVGEAPGVKFDFTESASCICQIANSEKRVAELKSALLEVVEIGRIAKSAAQKLRGRMQFAAGQIFGRTGKRCIKVLSDHAIGRRERSTERSIEFLKHFVELLTCAGPRIIQLDVGKPMLVSTDACYENEAVDWCCGLGGVLLDEISQRYMFFSIELTNSQRRILGEGSKKQLIFEAETLSAVLAFCLWQSELKHRLSYLFVDNEGSKYVLIRGASDNEVADCLAAAFCKREALFHSRNWISRVSSYTKCADAPSRGDISHLSQNGFIDVTADALLVLAELLASVEMRIGGNGWSYRVPSLKVRPCTWERRQNK